VQINSMLLSLINFRKFTDDEKWISYDNPKKKKKVDHNRPRNLIFV